MKTTIKTFMSLMVLGLIGFTNLNARAGSNDKSDSIAVEKENSLAMEAWMPGSDLWMEKTETKAGTVETEKPLEINASMTEEEFFKAAESYTAAGSDEEIEKYATRQMENSVAKAETEKNLEVKAWMTNEDFFKAAESYTASGSDKEVKNYATKLIALEDERESK